MAYCALCMCKKKAGGWLRKLSQPWQVFELWSNYNNHSCPRFDKKEHEIRNRNSVALCWVRYSKYNTNNKKNTKCTHKKRLGLLSSRLKPLLEKSSLTDTVKGELSNESSALSQQIHEFLSSAAQKLANAYSFSTLQKKDELFQQIVLFSMLSSHYFCVCMCFYLCLFLFFIFFLIKMWVVSILRNFAFYSSPTHPRSYVFDSHTIDIPLFQMTM